MQKAACTEEQITYALRQVALGTPVAEVCRKLGMSEPTCSCWKRRLRQLEEENCQLKPLMADLTLDQLIVRRHLRAPAVRDCPTSR